MFQFFRNVKADIKVVFERDPAVRSIWEVLLCYPGFHARQFHRLAHWLYQKGRFVLARIVSHFSRQVTGIEIHPGAKIGPGLFIDHGMGVVIGETAEIGANVTLFQGVTLGGTGKEKGKRHPTIGDNVVIATGAKVLGSFTVGDNVKIGSGSVVLESIPADCTVVGVPGRVVSFKGMQVSAGSPLEGARSEAQNDGQVDLQHHLLPDPVADLIQTLQTRVETLENKLAQIEMEAKTHGTESVQHLNPEKRGIHLA